MAVSSKRLIISETFSQDETIVQVDAKTFSSNTILEILNANKISINQSCGGSGTCGTCRIEIVSGHNSLKEKSHYESEQALELNLKSDQRLSCQSEINWTNEVELNIKIVGEII